MSDRPMALVCDIHSYEARVGVTLPCPWPLCKNGAPGRDFFRVPAVNPTHSYWPSESELYVATCDRVTYESRAFSISGDGTRSTMYVWVKRS